MLAYKKLMFEYYLHFRKGKFSGTIVHKNDIDNFEKYELDLSIDRLFKKHYGKIVLCYSVYHNYKIVILENINPDDILLEKELIICKTQGNASVKDKIKISLLNILGE